MFLTLEEIKERLAGKRFCLVAEATGLSYPTIKKLADGEVQNYALDTVRRVSAYLEKLQCRT